MLRPDLSCRRLRRPLVLLVLCATVAALNAGSATAGFTVQMPTGAVLIGPEPIPAATGSGTQTSPHVSGSVISYTDRQSGAAVSVKYVDLAAPGPGTQVPQDAEY